MRRLLPLTILALMLPGTASAHARLVASDPAANGVAVSVSSIELRFSEKIIARLSTATVASLPAAKAIAATAGPGKDGKSLRLNLSRRLAPGSYRVDYHVTSADTHRIGGSLSFRVK